MLTTGPIRATKQHTKPKIHIPEGSYVHLIVSALAEGEEFTQTPRPDVHAPGGDGYAEQPQNTTLRVLCSGKNTAMDCPEPSSPQVYSGESIAHNIVDRRVCIESNGKKPTASGTPIPRNIVPNIQLIVAVLQITRQKRVRALSTSISVAPSKTGDKNQNTLNHFEKRGTTGYES